MKRYKVTLDAEERQHLHDLIAARPLPGS